MRRGEKKRKTERERIDSWQRESKSKRERDREEGSTTLGIIRERMSGGEGRVTR